ncbi:hypothetical protein, partial [Gimesia maris]|uniref:hypothetical protein n=1 Tax=Gimesia maris TaxID=122 RepID=UPI003A946DBE
PCSRAVQQHSRHLERPEYYRLHGCRQSSFLISHPPQVGGGVALMAATASSQLLASPITPRQPFPLQPIFGADRQAAAVLPGGGNQYLSQGIIGNPKRKRGTRRSA